jgi:polar amino acid transport system substrate-binding protein
VDALTPWQSSCCRQMFAGDIAAPIRRAGGGQGRRIFLALIIVCSVAVPSSAQAPVLRWGGDKAGGAPFIYDEGHETVGFEWEIAQYLCKEIGRTPQFVQEDWDNLPELLARGNIDIALNGMEFRREWEPKYPSTLPYFIFNIRLIVRANDNTIRSWDDLRVAAGKPKKRVGVLRDSMAQRYLESEFGDSIELVPTKEVDETLQLVEAGARLDATVQDSPATAYYVTSGRLRKLRVVGEPVAKGFYVILTPKGDTPEAMENATQLRAELNRAIRNGIASGKFEEILRRYGLWDTEQERLAYIHLRPWPPSSENEDGPQSPSSKRDLAGLADKLAKAAWMTIALAICSMPIAILLGVLIAVARLYGPSLVRIPLTVYVEVLRGTPLLLQMYVWFFLMPQVAKWVGWGPLISLATLPPFVVGIFALAVNYSAYEAEIFRAGLQAVPKGQMEAALSLGLAPITAIRRILIPQAVRIVIPPVTNDFIALFKDTSICSMILITELTGLYYQNKFDRDLVLQLAFTIGLIYLMMSYPLSLLSRWLERRLRRQPG